MTDFVVALLVRGGTLALLTMLVLAATRRRSASLRHGVAGAGIIALLLFPLAYRLLPELPGTAMPLYPLPQATGADLLRTAFALTYLLVAALFLLRLAIRLGAAYRLVTTAQPLPANHPLTVQSNAAAATILGRRTSPAIALTDQVLVPMTAAQVVLLPTEALTWSPLRLQTALLHEFAHIRRRDWWLQLAVELTVALHWANPLAWALRRELHAAAELATDDLVLSTGTPAPDYATELLAIAQSLRKATP